MVNVAHFGWNPLKPTGEPKHTHNRSSQTWLGTTENYNIDYLQ